MQQHSKDVTLTTQHCASSSWHILIWRAGVRWSYCLTSWNATCNGAAKHLQQTTRTSCCSQKLLSTTLWQQFERLNKLFLTFWYVRPAAAPHFGFAGPLWPAAKVAELTGQDGAALLVGLQMLPGYSVILYHIPRLSCFV